MRALLIVFLLGCDMGVVAEPTTPEPAQPAFLLPSLYPRSPYQHVHDFQEYALRDGRVVRYDAYNANVVSIFEPSTKQVTELGRAALLAVPRMGWLVLTRGADGTVRLNDIDPSRDALRLVWQGGYPEVVGTLDGAIVISSERELIALTAPGVAQTLAKLPAGMSPASGDAIRGHRLLLVSGGAKEDGSWPARMTFDADVSIMDLQTSRVRKVGIAKGGYTMQTAIPHPFVLVHWADHEQLASERSWAEGRPNIVDVTTEQISHR
ncbi:MAG TPA: hypothetical protein VMZ53_23700 [Kofleriaceae bacterium]|nr:hypothetical protein [Kofleriaceae bacterium]